MLDDPCHTYMYQLQLLHVKDSIQQDHRNSTDFKHCNDLQKPTLDSLSLDGSIPTLDSLSLDGSIPTLDSLSLDGSIPTLDSLSLDGSMDCLSARMLALPTVFQPSLEPILPGMGGPREPVRERLKNHIHVF